MLENISNLLLMFGGVFLVIGVIATALMQKEIINPTCPQDAENVRRNKLWSSIMLISGTIGVVAGAVIKIFTA